MAQKKANKNPNAMSMNYLTGGYVNKLHVRIHTRLSREDGDVYQFDHL